jgi:hypothetical protein
LALAAGDIASHWQETVSDMATAVALLRDECGVLIGKWLPYKPMLIPLAAAWRDVAKAIGPAQGAMRARLKRTTCAQGLAGRWRGAAGRRRLRLGAVALADRDGAPTGRLSGDDRVDTHPAPTRFPYGRTAHAECDRGGQG